jgi:uncharacterized membrane protein YfcA
MLLLSGALFGSIAIVTVPALLMLYGVPPSVKTDAALKISKTETLLAQRLALDVFQHQYQLQREYY